MNQALPLSRQLPPAACKVLFGMVFAGGIPLTIQDLVSWTGLEHKAIRRALNPLETAGLVAAQVGRHNRHTWVPTGDTLFPQFSQEGKTTPSSSSRLIDSSDTQNLLLLPEPQFAQKAQTETLAALDAASIREPTRSELAALPHLTPQLVEGHVAEALADHQGLGRAIYRIRHNWPLRSATDPDQESEPGTGSRYAGGAFQELLDEGREPATITACIHQDWVPDGSRGQQPGKPCRQAVVAGTHFCPEHLALHESMVSGE